MNLNKDNWCVLPTKFGDLLMYDTQDEDIKLITASSIENIGDNPLLRMHSSCIASEVFGAKDCDCADQLHEAIKLLINERRGLIFHLNQEGRGHGLSKKIQGVSVMQKEQCDTAESFDKLGFEQDIRDYSKVIDILKILQITSVRLISNNPRKIAFLEKNNISVEVVNTHPKIRPENKDYLYSKNKKLGHRLPLEQYETVNTIYFCSSAEKWADLSNFSQHAIFLNNRIWSTVEHYYQAQKFQDKEYQEIIRQAETPFLAKQKAIELFEKKPMLDWNEKKDKEMFKALKAKFTQHPNLANLLISTNDKKIVERTDFDDYWGDGKDGNGKNRLGLLLMELREQMNNKLNTN